MIVRDVLTTKGTNVVTIRPTTSIADLVAELAAYRIGALVVSEDGSSVDGIISERDVVRALHSHGNAAMNLQVADVMTRDVRTCQPDDRVRDIARTMTDGRFRHLPVLSDGQLVGIVSIGDIVKKRIDELETEADQLMDYLTT